MRKINILGIGVDNLTSEEVVKNIKIFLKENKPKIIYTPNTEMIMMAQKDKELIKIINSADLVIPDGIGLIYASKIKKNPLKERVTGFDTSLKMLEVANEEKLKVFLLGGKEGVAKAAAEKIKERYPHLYISGYNNGYFKGAHTGFPGNDEELEVIRKINDSEPDILFVGLGIPKQEKWINLYKDKLKCKVIIGNGGTMDIIAGNLKRAPEVFQRLGLEWFYRLIKEPSRIKRQIVLPQFILKVIFNKDAVK